MANTEPTTQPARGRWLERRIASTQSELAHADLLISKSQSLVQTRARATEAALAAAGVQIARVEQRVARQQALSASATADLSKRVTARAQIDARLADLHDKVAASIEMHYGVHKASDQ